MSELALWFSRKFTFDFPVELYPNLRVRLRGAPARMEELARGLPPEQLVRAPQGKWSILENAGHLWDLEELWARRVEDYLAGAERLAAADLTNARTHNARHNERPLEEILGKFRAARLAWIERLESLAPAMFARTALHPRLNQPMRLVDHLSFVCEHDDHHLARIWELRREKSR